ncbi:MAG: zinc ribbon domain-containing protein [Sulfolobales archaeon]
MPTNTNRCEKRNSCSWLADEHSSTIVLENLSKLRSRVSGSSSFNEKLSVRFYRRIQFAMNYEALERGLLVSYINPMRTSSTCPRCGSRLENGGSRVLKRSKYGLAGDRNVVTCIDLFYGYSRCGGLGVLPNVPKGDANSRPMRGNEDEAMKPTNINLNES